MTQQHQQVAAPRPKPAKGSRVRFGILIVISVGTAINYLDRANMAIVAPALTKDLHLGAAEMGLIFSAFGWTYALLQIPAGWLIDKLGARLAFGYALVAWSLVTAAMGLSRGFGALFGLRLALGVAESPAFPANSALVASWFPKKERGIATASYTAGEYIGLALAAPVLALVATALGWQSVFYLSAGLGLAWAVVWFTKIRNSPKHSPKVSAEELALLEEGGAVTETATKDKARWSDIPKLLKNRQMIGVLVGQFANASTLFFFLTWFPSYLVSAKHFTLLSAGLLASIPYLTAMVGVFFAGSWSDWMLRRGMSINIARKAPIITGLALASVIILANYTDSPGLIITIMSVAFFAQGMSAISWSLVADIAPIGKLGITGGLFNFVGNLGGVVSPLVVGFVVQLTGSFVGGIGYIAVVAVIGALAYIFLVDKVERLSIS
ncbi:MAG TPA: MFS transporter [Arthrobacter sp.]|jgi:ACS family D-galactonate transporter-like MFS transporter